MQRKSKTFYKYILSNLFILFLPVIILFTVFFGAVQSRFSEEIVQSNMQLLTQVRDSFDTQLEQLLRISFLIQNDSSLRPGEVTGDIVKERKAVSTLTMYNSISTLPETIALYKEGTDRIYTSTSSMPLTTFWNQQYVYDSHTMDDFLAAIGEKSGIVTWGEDTVHQFKGNSRKYITLFIAVQSGNLPPKTRSVYLIPTDTLENMLTGITNGYHGGVVISDARGNSLTSFGECSNVLLENNAALSVESEEQSRQVKFDGKEYYISSVTSKVLGWEYSIAIPASAMPAPFDKIRNSILAGLVCIGIFGGVAVYLISCHHYRPLLRLNQKAMKYAGDSTSGDELQQAENAIDRLSMKSEEYLQTLYENRGTFLQDCLSRWLTGNISSIDALVSEMQSLGVEIDKNGECSVVSISARNNAEADLVAAIHSDSFGISDSLLYSGKESEGVWTLLVPQSEDEMELLIPLQDYLQTKLACPVAIGTSLPCSPMDVPEGYRQSMKALSLRMLRGDSCIVLYEKEMEQPIPLDYPQHELEELQLNLLQLDEESTKKNIDSILKGIIRKKTTFTAARMICFDVINTVIRCLYSISGENSSVLSSEMLEQLIGFTTVEELEKMLEDLVTGTCRSIEEMRKNRDTSRISKVQEYIAAECFDPNFSQYTVADHFGITPSNLTHFFRNSTGESISEYVQRLRKNEACRLLKTTDLSVSQIGEKIGMMNVSSFIRSFKQQTGMTPGQYRES